MVILLRQGYGATGTLKTENGKRKWDGAKKLGNKGADEAQKA
jgi:hypothetical protein